MLILMPVVAVLLLALLVIGMVLGATLALVVGPCFIGANTYTN